MNFILDMTVVRGATLNKGIRYSTVLGPSTVTLAIGTGSRTFPAQNNLAIGVGTRVRATVDVPVHDPAIFMEGAVTAYTSGQITVNVDTFSGASGAVFTGWSLTAAVDLTGGTFEAVMRLSPESCAGRARTPVSLVITPAPVLTMGIFTISLSSTVTASLTMGDYSYKVLFLPTGSSDDKLLVVSGTISVVDA